MKYSGNSDSLTTKRIGMLPCKIVLKCPNQIYFWHTGKRRW
jgi:hypothetical protein